MKVDSIKFEQKDGDAFPSEVTVTMSVVEAAQIACVFGEMSDKSITDRGWPLNNIYRDLTSNVFNRYWEDGVDDAMKMVFARSE